MTKIAASTLLAMEQHSKGKFDLDRSIGSYIPELTGQTPFGALKIREIMAHQAGLTPWIPFYKRTLTEGKWKPTIYQTNKSEDFSLEVAKGMFMRKDYKDSMYAQIMRSELGPKKYVYSDLCFYFIQKINEKIIQKKQNDYLLSQVYQPMGLRYLRYLPLNFFEKSKITPTENDKNFRNQLIHGYHE